MIYGKNLKRTKEENNNMLDQQITKTIPSNVSLIEIPVIRNKKTAKIISQPILKDFK